MKMSKKYKALLLSAVLMTLGSNAFAAASYTYGDKTYDSLWNVGSEDTTFTNWDVTVAPNDKVGRSDGKTLTFAGGSISGSAQMFESSGGWPCKFSTEE